MKNLFTLVILLCPALYGWADEENTAKKATDAHITGHIILKETGEHLPFMTILLKGTNIGTATDETGHFFLKNLPEGKYTLRVQGVGYKSAEKEIVIVKGKTQEVNFEISEDAVLLDGAVVTANRNETDRREAPVIVNVLSPKVFENTNSVCLSQGLNFQPGLRVENNCQNCGFQQVRINGLDGPYSQILIDSRPMCSSLAGVYGLEQIPANMVERVEVLRGGGSALFGSNAIAGTINIITREPLYNFFQVGHTLSAIDGESFDNVTSFNGAIVNEQRDAGIYLFGMVRDRQAYDHDDDGFSELGKINSTTLGFKTYYKPTERVLFHPEHRKGILLRCQTGHERLRENQRLHGCGRSPVLLRFRQLPVYALFPHRRSRILLQQTQRPNTRLPQGNQSRSLRVQRIPSKRVENRTLQFSIRRTFGRKL